MALKDFLKKIFIGKTGLIEQEDDRELGHYFPKKNIEIFEIWQECDKNDPGASCVIWESGKRVKLVAKIANGQILSLNKGFYIEKGIKQV